MLNTFVITGRPGSGKTVQADLLAEKMGFKRFSPGDKYREIATTQTAIGTRIKKIIDGGHLGPEWLSVYLFQDAVLHLSDTDGIVIEGLGRREDEAKYFNDVMNWLSRKYIAFNIIVSEEEATKRLLSRSTKEGREDDNIDVIPERIKEYDANTLPAIDFFKSVGKYVEINGEQSIEDVHGDILKNIGV